MACEADAAGGQQVVVGQGAGPHQLCAGGVVVRLFEGAGKVGDDGAQDSFAQAVRQIDIRLPGEVAFQDMGHDVHAAGSRLVSRQGVGEGGVEDGQPGA